MAKITRIDGQAPAYKAALRPFWRVGDLGIIVAPRNAGKSTLMIDIACAFAVQHLTGNDNPWEFGYCCGGLMKAEYPSNVLILDADNDAADWGTVFQQAMLAYRVPPNSAVKIMAGSRIHHAQAGQYNLNSVKDRKKGIDELIEDIDSGGYRVIIMDYLWRIFAPKDNGDTVWMTEGLGVLRAKCRERGVIILALSQPPMGEESKQLPIHRMRPYGTTQQDNITDIIINMTPTPGGGGINLYSSKRRFGPKVGGRVHVQFRSHGLAGYRKTTRGPWEWANEEVPSLVIPLMSDTQTATLEKFPLNGGPFSVADVDYREATVRQFLSEFLIPGEWVIEDGEPKKRGMPQHYRYTPEGIKMLHAFNAQE